MPWIDVGRPDLGAINARLPLSFTIAGLADGCSMGPDALHFSYS
jgi:hypothetical protein